MKILQSISVPGILLLLGGCCCTGVVDNTWNRIDLEPGSNAKCLGSPCEVYYVLPSLDGGSYTVTSISGDQGQSRMGTYKAGTKAYLGKLWAGQYRFAVEGTRLPHAVLAVEGTR